MNMLYKLVYLRETNFRFANIMKGIEFKVMCFLILIQHCPAEPFG